MKSIKFKIKDGKTSVHAEGYSGNACKDATKVFEDALGQVVEDEPTHEMHTEVEVEWLQQGGEGE